MRFSSVLTLSGQIDSTQGQDIRAHDGFDSVSAEYYIRLGRAAVQECESVAAAIVDVGYTDTALVEMYFVCGEDIYQTFKESSPVLLSGSLFTLDSKQINDACVSLGQDRQDLLDTTFQTLKELYRYPESGIIRHISFHAGLLRRGRGEDGRIISTDQIH